MSIKNIKDLKPYTLFSLLFAVLILLGGGYYMYSIISDVPDNDTVKTINISEDGIPEAGEGYTVEIIPAEQELAEIPSPNLDRPIVFYTEFPAEVKEVYRERINTLVSWLKDGSDEFNNWLQLGIQYKTIGDYEGAEEVWQYVSAISPTNNISYLNLGDLYHYYLKDFPKAEESLRTAIKNDPTYIQGYVMLYDLYRYSYKTDTTSAVDILQEGLENHPDNIDLLATLALYYKVNEDISSSNDYYKKASAAAKNQGDTARASLLEAEIFEF